MDGVISGNHTDWNEQIARNGEKIMINFGLGFLFGGMAGVLITSLCIASSHNDLDINDDNDKETSDE